jgi:hypothetical protein
MRASIRAVTRVVKSAAVRPTVTLRATTRQFSTTPASSSFLYTGPTSLVQQQAPDFKATALVNGEFKEITMKQYAGKWVVLFFYPLVSVINNHSNIR